MSDITTKDKGLAVEVDGVATLNLDEMNRSAIPNDWKIEEVFGDILMCKYLDESDDGDVMRGGLVMSIDITQQMWRVVEVVKVGPDATGHIKIGDSLIIPGTKGVPCVDKDGLKLIFINEERVFAKVSKIDSQ